MIEKLIEAAMTVPRQEYDREFHLGTDPEITANIERLYQ